TCRNQRHTQRDERGFCRRNRPTLRRLVRCSFQTMHVLLSPALALPAAAFPIQLFRPLAPALPNRAEIWPAASGEAQRDLCRRALPVHQGSFLSRRRCANVPPTSTTAPARQPWRGGTVR